MGTKRTAGGKKKKKKPPPTRAKSEPRLLSKEAVKRQAKAEKKAKKAGKAKLKTDPSAILLLTPKKKCCKSSTRCVRCPVVLHRLEKSARTCDFANLSGKERSSLVATARRK